MSTRLLLSHVALSTFLSLVIHTFAHSQCSSPTDCDGDGVLNSDDLDDDNDGILDSNEGYLPPSVTTLDPVPYNSTLNGVNNAVSGNLVTIVRDCLPDLTVDFSFISTGGDIPNLTSENGGNQLRISYDPNLTGTSQVTYTFSEAVDVTISFRRNNENEAVSFITPYDNITPGAGSTILSATYPVLWHNGNGGAFTDFEFLAVTSVTLELKGDGFTQFQQMSMVYLDNATCLDTDNDGISDHQDLDSDDDLCNDVTEVGHSDPEDDGILATTPTIVDPSNGLVTGTGVTTSYNGNQPAVVDDNSNICAVLLPVELVDFKVDCNEEINTASWKTVSEQNNSHFDLQGTRELSKATQWETLSTLKGLGNSTTEQNYSVEFSNREYKYFRLNQVDFSGNSEFSEITYANCFEDQRFCTVYLGTDNSSQFLLINGLENELVEIVDFSGRVLYKQWIKSDDQPIKIDVSEFSSGIYIAHMGSQSQLFRK